MISIITAIYDEYDTIKCALPQTVDVEFLCVTDSAWLGDREVYNGWKIKYLPRPELSPNRAAKIPKILPWDYTRYDKSIWIDASFRIKSYNFAEEVIKFAQPIAQFVHPWRDCIYSECEELLRIKRYSKLPVTEQVTKYKNLGHPKNWGLWATGVMARLHTKEVIDFCNIWMNEVDNHTFRDQLSHPYALRESNLRPVSLPGTHFSNRWLSYEGSGRH